MAVLFKEKGLTQRYAMPTDKGRTSTTSTKKRSRARPVIEDPELMWLATNTRATYEGAIDSLSSILFHRGVHAILLLVMH